MDNRQKITLGRSIGPITTAKVDVLPRILVLVFPGGLYLDRIQSPTTQQNAGLIPRIKPKGIQGGEATLTFCAG